MRLSTRIILLFSLTALASILAMVGATRVARGLPLSIPVTMALAALLVSPIVLWSARAVNRRIRALNDDLGNALQATRDGDYSLRLVVRGDSEIAELKALYNELADSVRQSRFEIQNKEIMLDTILQRTPIGVMLLDPADRVIYSNHMARELISAGARVDGKDLDQILAPLDPLLGQVLRGGSSSLFNAADETFHITQRSFQLHTRPHRLILIERLTPELRRQEVTVWKKAIRVINHEINNSVAPISSLFHSARRAQDRPEHRHRLEEIYELIEERLRYLRGFLESYAQFARLPDPRRERVRWNALLEDVRALYPFTIDGHPELETLVDPGQMQQMLINLVKNAHESGSVADDVVVSVQRVGTDDVVQVMDRGRGMSDQAMRQALVPFFTTKPEGTGLGLALCNEIVEGHGGRMRLEARDGGGTVVTCWIPARGAGSVAPGSEI